MIMLRDKEFWRIIIKIVNCRSDGEVTKRGKRRRKERIELVAYMAIISSDSLIEVDDSKSVRLNRDRVYYLRVDEQQKAIVEFN